MKLQIKMTDNHRQITPSEAFELYPKTGVLILLDLPEKITVGFDNTSFQVSEKFKGFKLIPPGCHFLHVTDQVTEGEFLWIGAGDVLVKQWAGDSMDSDQIWTACNDKEKAENLAAAARNLELDPFLAAYQYQHSAQWSECTKFITKRLLKRTKVQSAAVKGLESGSEYRFESTGDCKEEMQQRI